MTYRLSQVLLEDLPALIEMESELFGHDAWSPSTMVAEVSHPQSYYLLARQDGTDILCGYAGLRAALSGGDLGDIQTLAVVPDHRRAGLGRLLLNAVLDEARRRGVGEVLLEVRADNTAARALYEAEGFMAIDVRKGYYQPDGVDAIVMAKQLETKGPAWAVGHD